MGVYGFYDESINPEPEQEPFEYVGEMIDPEQAPLTQSVFACTKCGALVIWSMHHLHEASHVEGHR